MSIDTTKWTCRKKARKAAGLTHRQSAEALEITITNLSLFEKGYEMPIAIASNMAKLYGVSQHYMQYGIPRTLNDDLAEAYGFPEANLETIRRRHRAGILPIKIDGE